MQACSDDTNETLTTLDDASIDSVLDVTDANPNSACAYQQVSGRCSITELSEVNRVTLGCQNEPREVFFTFVPDDPSEALPSDTQGTFIISGGDNPPLSCLEKFQIDRVGRTFECTRSTITRGTCSPITYAPDGVDAALSDTCIDDCER